MMDMDYAPTRSECARDDYMDSIRDSCRENVTDFDRWEDILTRLRKNGHGKSRLADVLKDWIQHAMDEEQSALEEAASEERYLNSMRYGEL